MVAANTISRSTLDVNTSGASARSGSAILPLDRLMARPGALDRFTSQPTHTVRAGDTLSDIARRYGTSWQVLARVNGITNPDRIMPGQVLRLAGVEATTHSVRPGETLSGIAASHGVGWRALARLNDIANPDRIMPGQLLRLPTATDVSSPVRSAPVERTAPAQRVTAPATGDQPVGRVSERYESGGRGPGTVSNGRGDPGGVSYGVYQLSSNAGTLGAFVRNEGARWAGELGGGQGGAAFSDRWRAIAARDPQGFREAQHAFIQRTHFTPATERVAASTGLNLATRHAAVREATWSTSVQHGGAHTILADAVRRTDAQVARTSPDYDRQLVSNIYAVRSDYVANLARTGNYSSAERAQLISITQNRYPNEGRDVLAMFDRPTAPAVPAQGTTPTAAPGRAADARSAAEFAAIIADQGSAQARADLAAGRKVMVAVRQDTSTAANGGNGTYDDRMALVWRRPDGTYAAQTFTGNTDPAGRYAARGYGQDINGDGRKELGRLVEGNYRYELQSGNFAGNRFFRATETQVARRDSNHDGDFTAADGLDRSGAGRSMLIHQGGSNSTGSAGCQTLRPGDYNALLAGLGRQTSFSYVLVNAGR
jgi:LysM repeat protein